jgi:hypothetical protein
MSWDDNWVRAVVGIGVAALGAIIAGVVNAYAAKLKIKEIELNYRYKLRDGYLDNARKLTGEVYIPISVALTNLLKGYERFAANSATPNLDALKEADDEFCDCCRDYLATLDGLLARGADAYLTLELDYWLNDFTNFIRNSLSQKELRKARVVHSPFSIIDRSPEFATEAVSPEKMWIFLRGRPFLGLRYSYSEKILAAPLTSNEFDRVIRLGVAQLKSRIKEVTLGAHPPR